MSARRAITDDAVRSMTIALMQFQADAQRRGCKGEYLRYDRLVLDLAAILRAIKAEREGEVCSQSPTS